LNQFGSFLQISQKKDRKEKEKRKGKEEKAPRTDSGPQPKTAHGPTPSLYRIGITSFSSPH
jgi:hypothetical protein